MNPEYNTPSIFLILLFLTSQTKDQIAPIIS
jgi:hypothetical protein